MIDLSLYFQVKVWYQNRRTKHKRLKSEDGNTSSNDMHEEDDDDEQPDESIEHDPNQPNQSDLSDSMNKNDDEHSWDNHNPHYQFISQSSTPRSSVSDRYYLHLAAAAAVAAKNGASDEHR